MKHKNIAIFVPHAGCPHACSFCNQKTITAQQTLPQPDDVVRICTQALAEIQDPSNAEIAFFGGSFTAIPQDYMTSLLKAAQPFLGAGRFAGIRISTRPDCISEAILRLLLQYGVTSIELGAQSMCDAVLTANLRGHTAQDVRDACACIRSFGFGLGLQMMTGLYGSTPADDLSTVERIVEIHPDTVRMYPVVVLRGTRLGQLYEAGSYILPSMDEMIDVCADAMLRFREAGIAVIKCGLHASEFVERDRLAGYYHPAFRELCEGRIFRRKMAALPLSRTQTNRIAVHPACISRAVGQKRANILYFAQQGIDVKIIGDGTSEEYEIELRE